MSRHEDNREDFKQNLRWVESCELGQHLRQMESFEGDFVPKARKRNQIDVLIEADHYEPIYSIRQVTGTPNKPCA